MKKNPKKIRVDELLVLTGETPSRTKAQALIMSGLVYVGEQRVEKSSQLVDQSAPLRLKAKGHGYVSRGGIKLKAALDHFKINVTDQTCLDVGASTGGFTDCLLKGGAKKVYAVDVGYGQIDWALRNDPRVVVIERTNFRNFDLKLLADPIDMVTVDVSFISLTKIIPKIVEIFTIHDPRSTIHEIIALIKPQFEVGRKFVGKKGVVKDQNKVKECIAAIEKFCEQKGLSVVGTIPSPILGFEGNREYLLLLRCA